jgi:predicted acetyltransferase
MDIELRTPERTERELIRRMMELYLYDFSEYEDTDLDEHGLFVYGDLDYFWFEPTHAAFLIRAAGKLAGFVLVDNDVKVEGNERSICEFFVMRKYRRQGVGRAAAIAVFDQMPGKWEAAVMANNLPAQGFWDRVLHDYTQGAFAVTALNNDEWQGPVYSFDNSR